MLFDQNEYIHVNQITLCRTSLKCFKILCNPFFRKKLVRFIQKLENFLLDKTCKLDTKKEATNVNNIDTCSQY